MKTKNIVFITLFITGILLIAACTKDDNDEPVVLNPTLNLTGGGQGFVSGDVTLPINSAFKIGVNIFSNSGVKLVSLEIIRIFNNKPDTTIIEALNATTFTKTYDFLAQNTVGPENWILKAVDKDNYSTTVSFIVTTEINAGEIISWTQKILGAQASLTGSSFASADGNVYNLQDAKANATKIDWLYFYGSQNLATLAAPDDADAATIFTDEGHAGQYALTTWNPRNPTRFKKVTTSVDWDSIQDDQIIVELASSGVTEPKANQLAAGNILAFSIASGKLGLIRIDAISGLNSSGTITISVKVQK